MALSVEIVAQVWVGHSSGAVFTFAADGTFTADGVPTAAFDTASPFAKDAPKGPYTCGGRWVIGPEPTELTVRFERIEDPQGKRPHPGRHELVYHGVYDGAYPQYPVLLHSGEDWLAPQ
ncbi:hypothetical protein [Dactylosporangium sp. NPDC051541]|uniref:hypothetical protein n=1 Tax=Dactylosporangium sp. NPDC051541 TaxID=3363977 RepID=UPI0037885C87